MNAQILSVDTVSDKRCSKSTTPLIWLETAQSTHLDAAYSPGRGCSSEAINLEHGFAGWERSGKIRSITADPDLLQIIEELSGNATSNEMRCRILAFEIQQLRVRLAER
jgi:hypothetical protein